MLRNVEPRLSQDSLLHERLKLMQSLFAKLKNEGREVVTAALI